MVRQCPRGPARCPVGYSQGLGREGVRGSYRAGAGNRVWDEGMEGGGWKTHRKNRKQLKVRGTGTAVHTGSRRLTGTLRLLAAAAFF